MIRQKENKYGDMVDEEVKVDLVDTNDLINSLNEALILTLKGREKAQKEANKEDSLQSAINSKLIQLDVLMDDRVHNAEMDTMASSVLRQERAMREKTLLNLGAIDKETAINAAHQRKLNEIEEKRIKTIESAQSGAATKMISTLFGDKGMFKGLERKTRFTELIKGVGNQDLSEKVKAADGVKGKQLAVIDALMGADEAGQKKLLQGLSLSGLQKKIITDPKVLKSIIEAVRNVKRSTAKANQEATGAVTLEEEKRISELIGGKTAGGVDALKERLSGRSFGEMAIKERSGRAEFDKTVNDWKEKGLKNIIEDESLSKEALQLQKGQNITEATSSSLAAEQLRAQSEELLQTYAVQTILKNKVNQKISQAALDAEQAFVESQILKDTKKLAEFAKNLNATELTTLQNSNTVNAEKLEQAIASGQLTELARAQLDTERTAQTKSALLLADKELLLSLDAELIEESRRALEIERQANGLKELRLATDKASMSPEQLMRESATRVRTDQTNQLSGVREAAADAANLGTPQGILSFAQKLEEYNKAVGNASGATDRLRVKMAELNVGIEDLNADLISITIDNLRTGLKDLFMDIGTGAKSASEAWEAFGLKLADEILGRIMQRNIDKIISDLTFAFTGEDGQSDLFATIDNTSAIQMNTSAIAQLTSSLATSRSGFTPTGYNEGGFVNGPPGVDKVPAMLTAGEYVIPKDQARKMQDGGRVSSLVDGIARAAVMYGVSEAMAPDETDVNGRPIFNQKKFNTLGLGSDLDLKRDDRRMSSKFISEDAVTNKYGDYLMDLNAYENEQKNKKFEKRLGIVKMASATLRSYGMQGAVEIARDVLTKPISWLKDTVTDWAGEKWNNVKNWGGEKFGKYGEEFTQFKGQLPASDNQSGLKYSKFAKARASGELFNYKGRAYESSNEQLSHQGYVQPFRDIGAERGPSLPFELQRPPQHDTHIDYFRLESQKAATRAFNNSPFNVGDASAKGAIRRASGGSIPTMLTAGEGYVPAPIAQRIGYNNLNYMNSTGDMPIIQGQGGVDNVGPMGLNEGDFIIRKSSTDKLLNNNPNMMRFAMQNPEGFKRGAQGYYEGGLVGEGDLTMPSVSLSDQPAQSGFERGGSSQVQGRQLSSSAGSSETTNNISINVSIDGGGVETSTGGEEGSSYEKERDLSLKIKGAVLEVIREEKRIGGELS